MQSLLEKIEKKEARVVVIGAGYVGLPFAVESAKAGFETIAFDLSKEKVEKVNRGKSYIGDISDKVLGPLVQSGALRATNDSVVMGGADAIIICVPTPLNKTKDPDVSLILNASETLLPHLKRGQLIVLESTTYPGFTREVLKEQLERTGMRIGRDIHLAFSPERVDPGNPTFHTKNTPKVIGGITKECSEAAVALYKHFIDTIIQVSSCDAAEMVKILENTFRAVNIGLVNEVALMCKKLNLDTWEVIDAAATKPFGFMPFYPGPGLGGHCIPVDPHYLSWKLKTLKYTARFIEMAGEINSGMPEVVVQLIADSLNDRMKPVNSSKILVLGIAYKSDIDDVRESPALDLMELLKKRGAVVSYHDPHVPKFEIGQDTIVSVPLENLESFDCAVIVTNHSIFDYAKICRNSQLVVDTRNATRQFRNDFADKIVSL
ncbi:MAG: nucleotide sugar dehydrogenase [Pseudomonadota bacterium]